MDLKWLMQKEIKQEEPVDYFLISTQDEEVNVTFDKYSNGDILAQIPRRRVKQEASEHVEPDGDETAENLEYENEETDQETSEYEPDVDCEDNEEENGSDEDWSDENKKKKSKKPSLPKYKFDEISIVEDIPCEGPPYTCNVCSLTFPVEKSLIAHRSIHKGKKFQCSICNKVFRNKGHIYEHMKSHLEPQYSCPICSKKFALKKSFIHHQAIHEEKKLKCDICSKLFRQKGHISEHMKTHRERIRRYPCQICDMAYYEQRTLNRHMKYTHSTASRKRFRCPNALCDKYYSSISSFKMHACVDGRRPQKLLNTNCPMCNKQFFNKFELNRHMKRTHVTKPDNFNCIGCNKTFLYRYWDSFVLHVQQKCAKTIMYECEYCSKMVQSKTKLIEHFDEQHSIISTSKAVPCPECSKLFFNKNNLNYHLKKSHLELKCDRCNKSFRSKTGVSLHQKRCLPKKTFDKYSKPITGSDPNPKTESLHECNKKINLLKHMTQVHLKKKFQLQPKTAPPKYVCLICNQSFKTLLTLCNHKDRRHKNKRIFKCQMCNMKFTVEKLYQKHLKKSKCVKTEHQQYQCTICPKIYSRNTNLKKHVKQMHLYENEHFSCDVCDRSFNTKRSILSHLLKGDHRTTFQCEFCLAIFKRISGYKTHILFCKSNGNEEEFVLS